MSLKSLGSYFITIIIIMVGIFAVKWVSKKYNVPVLSTLSDAT